MSSQISSAASTGAATAEESRKFAQLTMEGVTEANAQEMINAALLAGDTARAEMIAKALKAGALAAKGMIQ
jgi:hypothetical protein